MKMIKSEKLLNCFFRNDEQRISCINSYKEYGRLVAKEIFKELEKEMVGDSESLWEGFEIVKKKFCEDEE